MRQRWAEEGDIGQKGETLEDGEGQYGRTVQGHLPVLGRRVTIVRGAALLGGVAWLLLVPAAELTRRELLSYDGYNRFLALPLLLFTVALSLAAGALGLRERLARVGFAMAASGAGLLLIGNIVEFYGVLLQDRLNAYAASRAGEEDHWIGSDLGWMIFGLGMFVLLAGGLIAAMGLCRSRTEPRWLVVFAATLGIGVLAGNLFGLAPAFLSVPVLVIYAGGWMAFGRRVGAAHVARSSSTA